MKIPLVSVAILTGQVLLANARGATPLNKVAEFASFYTGFSLEDGTFLPQNLLIGYGPWLAKRFLLPIARPGASLSRMHLPISIS